MKRCFQVRPQRLHMRDFRKKKWVAYHFLLDESGHMLHQHFHLSSDPEESWLSLERSLCHHQGQGGKYSEPGDQSFAGLDEDAFKNVSSLSQKMDYEFNNYKIFHITLVCLSNGFFSIRKKYFETSWCWQFGKLVHHFAEQNILCHFFKVQRVCTFIFWLKSWLSFSPQKTQITMQRHSLCDIVFHLFLVPLQLKDKNFSWVQNIFMLFEWLNTI